MVEGKLLVMMATSSRGGIAAVMDAYERDGVFRRWNVRVLHSNLEGGLAQRLIAAVGALLQLILLLLSGRVGLLHSHVSMGGSFWRKAVFSELARLFRVPVILHLHGSGMEIFYNAQGAVGRNLIRYQLEKADRVVVLSESWRDFVLRVAPGARVEIVVNYVTLPPASVCGKPHAGLRVLFLGLLGHRKGIYDLLPAFKRALMKTPGMRLLIGGNGEVTETLEAIHEYGLTDAVEMLGWVAGDAKETQLSIADVFVLPSYNEGLPISLLEAMSYGVPVISTRVGGIPELIRNGVDEYLIEAGDQEALEDRLGRLAADVELRHQMGEAARERVATGFSDAVVLPILEEIFMDILFRSKKTSISNANTAINSLTRNDDNESSPICNNCGSARHFVLYEAGKAQVHQIVKCSDCGLMYAFPLARANLTSYMVDVAASDSDNPISDSNETVQRGMNKLPDYKKIETVLRSYLPKGHIVEVGAYSGILLNAFKNLGWRVTGIEPDGRAVEYARRCYGIDMHNGTLENSGLDDNAADAVVMLHVIEHIDNPSNAVNAVRRLLRDDGIFVIETPTYDSLAYRMLGRRERSLSCDGHIFFYTETTLKRLLSNHGFSILRTERVGRTMSMARLLWNIGVISKSPAFQHVLQSISVSLKLDRYYIYLNARDMIRIYAKKV